MSFEPGPNPGKDPLTTHEYRKCNNPDCERPAVADGRCSAHERRDEKTAADLARAGLFQKEKIINKNKEKYEIKSDFSESYLVRADLQDTYISGADLSDANLSDANLTNSDLSSANLTNSDRSSANTQNADLTDADLSNADLSNANLPNANLSNANLSNANLSNANLSSADLSNANLSNARLLHTDLSASPSGDHTRLIAANLANTKFVRADLSGVDLFEPSKDKKQDKKIKTILSLLTELINSHDEQTVVRGLRAIGEISDTQPSVCEIIVNETHQAVAATDSTVGKVSGIRALTTVALETDTTVSAADKTFADCLRATDDYLRTETTIAVAPVVAERPEAYPKTIQALRERATDGQPSEAIPALQALAVVSGIQPQDVPPDELRTAVDRLSNDSRVPEPTVSDLQTALQGVEQ